MSLIKDEVRPAIAPSRRSPGMGRPALLTGALAMQGLALAILVGLAGSLEWRVARVAFVVGLTAAGMWALRNGRRLRAGVVALIGGLVGTVAGLGVGVGHLAKADYSAAAVLGAVILTTGLVLLLAGAAILVRRLPGWWRLLALPAAGVLLVFVFYPLPQAVYATNVPATEVGASTPADLGLTYEDVAFTTADRDAARLSGWYLPSTNRAAVVLLHGAGSTRSGVLDHAAVLARHGYGVLLFDARGHGASEGTAMDWGWYGEADVAAAVRYLQTRPDVDPRRIGAVGESLGGEVAIGAAGTDDRIRAVVAEGATGRQLADHGWLPGGINGALERGLEYLQYGLADLLTSADRPISLPDGLRAAAARPVLIIAGGTVWNETAAAEHYRQASPGNVEVWVVPGAGHTGGLATAREEWQARVTAFLDSALLGP